MQARSATYGKSRTSCRTRSEKWSYSLDSWRGRNVSLTRRQCPFFPLLPKNTVPIVTMSSSQPAPVSSCEFFFDKWWDKESNWNGGFYNLRICGPLYGVRLCVVLRLLSFLHRFGNLKNKALSETVRNVQLENKCNGEFWYIEIE